MSEQNSAREATEQVDSRQMASEQNTPQQSAPELDVILASGSPRRRQLLHDAGVAFRVHTPMTPVDETLDADMMAQPEEAAKKLAERKAGAVVQEILAAPDYEGQAVVIGADTMVVKGGQIYGKPRNVDHAKQMLRSLSGSDHQVITGVSVWVVLVPHAEPEKVSMGFRSFTETSTVTFRQLDDHQIADYLLCGESFDKAGAYAIQGEGAGLVEGYAGDYDNIVGLPVTKLLEAFPDLKG